MEKAKEAVLKKSKEGAHHVTTQIVKGPELTNGLTLETLIDSLESTGFQATNLSLAIKEIRRMRSANAKIYLGFTSNMVSCGLREIIRYLAQNKLVDVMVTTAGAIEEDIIKCLAPTLLSSFEADGLELREHGMNRIGNLVVPNDNYCLFEEWMKPRIQEALEEQKKGRTWTPSTFVDLLGCKVNSEESVLYWAHKNSIPIFCPAITDGSIGDMLSFHGEGLVIDVVADIRAINRSVLFTKRTGAVILGGGVIKHHILNANLMRNGLDYLVVVNTSADFDGSDTGASLNEARSWGKVGARCRGVKVCCDATLIAPLLVHAGFGRELTEEEIREESSVLSESEE